MGSMPQRCSVPGCNATYQNTLNVSFHTFPRDEKVRRHWQRICADKISPKVVLDNLRVCSLHFPSKAYRDEAGCKKKRLKSNAVPSLHLPPSFDALGEEINISDSSACDYLEDDDDDDERYLKSPKQRRQEADASPEVIYLTTTNETLIPKKLPHLRPIAPKPAAPEDTASHATLFSTNGIHQGTKKSFSNTSLNKDKRKVPLHIRRFNMKKGMKPARQQRFKTKPRKTANPRAIVPLIACFASNKEAHQETEHPANVASPEIITPEIITPEITVPSLRAVIMKDGSLQFKEDFPETVIPEVRHSILSVSGMDEEVSMEEVKGEVIEEPLEDEGSLDTHTLHPTTIITTTTAITATTTMTTTTTNNSTRMKEEDNKLYLTSNMYNQNNEPLVKIEEVEDQVMVTTGIEGLWFESANHSWGAEEPTNTTVSGARNTSSLITVDDSYNSSNDEMLCGRNTRDPGMEEENGGDDNNTDDGGSVDDSYGCDDDLWQKVTNTDVRLPKLPPPPFVAIPGPRNIPHLQRPSDFVRLFITPTFTDTIARETNRCADQWIEKHKQSQYPHHQQTIHNWVKSGKTTSEEIYAFLAVTMNMSLILKPSVASYWDNTNRSQATPWFREHFVLERYTLIMKFLSFADVDTIPNRLDPSYKLYEVQPLIAHFCRVFRYYFKPHHRVTLGKGVADCGNIKRSPWHCASLVPADESAVKAACPLDEYSVKIWYLCDVEIGYAVTFEVDVGSLTEKLNKEDEVYDLVMRLMEAGDVLYQGYHLYVGSCFVSPQLLFDLWKCQTLGTGMVLPHQRGLPVDMMKARSKKWQACKQKKGPLYCVIFKDPDGKRRLLLSSASSIDFAYTRRTPKDKVESLPRIIDDHRKATNNANIQTLTLQTYIPEWSSLRWSTRVAMSIISTAFLNAYLLYTATTTDSPRLTQYSFMVSAIEGLVEGYVSLQDPLQD